MRAFLEQVASFSRLIYFDKRGTGMSDRVARRSALETRMDDVRAVMDAVGSERAALVGWSEGCAMSALFAATYPERAWALVLYGGKARQLRAPDYPWGQTEAEALRAIAEERNLEPSAVAEEMARSGMPTAAMRRVAALTRMFRQSASPGALEAFSLMNIQIDIRQVLPGDPCSGACPAQHARPLGRRRARQRPGAADTGCGVRRVPDRRPHPTAADLPPVVDEIERFLRDVWKTSGVVQEPDRVLATVMFTDIVGATSKAAEMGDARWRELLESHHLLIRRQLARPAARRWTPPATASSLPSTAPRGRSGARARSPSR